MKGVLVWLVIVALIGIANRKKKKPVQRQAGPGVRKMPEGAGAGQMRVNTPGIGQVPGPEVYHIPENGPGEVLPSDPSAYAPGPDESPFADPLPREGHESCDTTEGSIEIPGRSPEGISTEGELPPERLNPAVPIPDRSAARRVGSTGVIAKRDLRRAVILKEVLDRPVSMRE